MDGKVHRATSRIGRWTAVTFTTFPKAPAAGLAELDRSPAVRTFRAFARFPGLTVTRMATSVQWTTGTSP